MQRGARSPRQSHVLGSPSQPFFRKGVSVISGPQFPLPANEPEVVEIPTVINGKRYFSNDVVEVRAPHDTQRLLARIHRPGSSNQ